MTAAPERPLPVAALSHWLRLLPALLPALLLAYLANGLALLADHPKSSGSEAVRALLLLGASWFGQAWAAAAVQRREQNLPVGARLLLGDLRRAGPGLWAAGLLRAILVYTPTLLVALLGAARAGQGQQPGTPNPLPVAALVLLPLSLNLAALLAFTPAVGATARLRPGAVLAQARQLGARQSGSIWAIGLLLGVPIFLTSFLPGDPPRLFPNHVLGSLLWVALATTHARALGAAAAALDGSGPAPGAASPA